MKRRSTCSTVAVYLSMLCLNLSCRNQEPHAVLARLEADSPVDAAKLTASDCKLSSTPLDSSSPITVKSSESLELTGIISPGEWSTVGIMNPPMERPNRSIDPGVRCIVLSLFIHGSDMKTENGLKHAMMIEAEPVGKPSQEFRFRAKFKTPAEKGNYVIDLHAQDMSNDTRQRGDDPNKIPGLAIWRRELSVK